MVRYIFFHYNDNDGPQTRAFTDASAAVKQFIERNKFEPTNYEFWMGLLAQNGFIDHVSARRLVTVSVVQKTEVF